MTGLLEMSITLQKLKEGLYQVSATAAQYRAKESWAPEEPLDRRQIAEELLRRGFHPQDIGDAFDDADRRVDGEPSSPS